MIAVQTLDLWSRGKCKDLAWPGLADLPAYRTYIYRGRTKPTKSTLIRAGIGTIRVGAILVFGQNRGASAYMLHRTIGVLID